MSRKEGGPNVHLNRAMQRIRQACEELIRYRADYPEEVKSSRNSLFCDNFKTLAAYDAADVVIHLLQHTKRQIGEIKSMSQTDETSEKSTRAR